ncbi:MAG: hypothetical protein HOP19_00490 [Acidobacteria bacterium]|nr:hypothetical protein [Acidobacteriota bacterium]
MVGNGLILKRERNKMMSLEVETECLEIVGLPSGTTYALEELARSNGNKSAEEYARLLLEAKVLAQKPFKEILAPTREGFAESGMTDDELAALVENAREDFYRKRLAEDQ